MAKIKAMGYPLETGSQKMKPTLNVDEDMMDNIDDLRVGDKVDFSGVGIIVSVSKDRYTNDKKLSCTLEIKDINFVVD